MTKKIKITESDLYNIIKQVLLEQEKEEKVWYTDKEEFNFRQDLVGLRGLAIISVLLFHYFPFHRLTSGGFIGVDIFKYFCFSPKFLYSGLLVSTKFTFSS